ncbi:hypothetical protein F183_A23630 [Bryobacterales bacterium F-183]|nr:hypothetical protein F183_A23630 [Bryobacterales bacterium F-183]
MERLYQFSLLGLLTSGYLAVVSSGLLDLPTAVLTGLALILRGLMAAGLVQFQAPPKLTLIATLAYIGFYPLDYFVLSQDFIPATIHLVFFLSVLRILTAQTERDYLYVQLLALLEILGACILSAQLNFLVFLVIFILFGLLSLAAGELRRASLDPQTAVVAPRRLSLRLIGFLSVSCVMIFTLAAGLFFLLPRTAHAAFRQMTPARYHLPGFSNEVTLGEIGEVKQSNEPVMYIKMLGDYQPRDIHWRGSALQSFDGKRWFNARFKQDQVIKIDGQMVGLVSKRPVNARRFYYEVRVKDIASDVLFFAGKPEFLAIDQREILKTSTGGYRAPLRPPTGFRYIGYSYMDTIVFDRNLAEQLTESDRAAYLALPPKLDPRMTGLAMQLTAGSKNKFEEARSMEFRLQRMYGYTLQLPETEPADPLAHFLFERRKGHCEYFASAMAVLLRLRGIPSRVVTGFQDNGEDPVNGWRIVRAADAHSWVEGYLQDQGWVVFDPTPADPAAGQLGLLTRISRVWDSLELFWTDWVVGYDLDRQISLAARMQRSSRGAGSQWLDRLAAATTWFQEEFPKQAKTKGMPLVGGVILAVLLYIYGPPVWRGGKRRYRLGRIRNSSSGAANDATVLYEQMLELLHKRGIEKPVWLTPVEFARIIPEPGTAGLVADFTDAYLQLRYGGNREAVPRMFSLIARLEQDGVRR